MHRNWLIVVVAAVAAGLALSCKDRTQTFQVKGVVQEVMPARKQVKIKHEKIPDYMDAMTMVFDVKDGNELTGLQPGDSVEFRMLVTEKDGWIDRLKKLNSAPAPPPIESFRRVREVEPLSVGDKMPDYRFTNELGRAVSLGDYKGQAVAFTFIFTRCPFPTFCPRMSDNFSETIKRLKEMSSGPTNVHFLTITFDPAFDTPAVLKHYAERFHADPAYWNFLTGAMIDIDAITEQFGFIFYREGTGLPSHNLRTIVIDAQGLVHHKFDQNEWTVEELVAQMVQAAKR